MALPAAAGDRRDNRDRVGGRQRRLVLVQVPYVLVVDVYIDEAAQLSFVREEVLLQCRVGGRQGGERFGDGAAGHSHRSVPAVELAKGRGYQNLRHGGVLTLPWRLLSAPCSAASYWRGETFPFGCSPPRKSTRGRSFPGRSWKNTHRSRGGYGKCRSGPAHSCAPRVRQTAGPPVSTRTAHAAHRGRRFRAAAPSARSCCRRRSGRSSPRSTHAGVTPRRVVPSR